MGLRSMFALCPLWAFLWYQSIIRPSNVIVQAFDDTSREVFG